MGRIKFIEVYPAVNSRIPYGSVRVIVHPALIAAFAIAFLLIKKRMAGEFLIMCIYI